MFAATVASRVISQGQLQAQGCTPFDCIGRVVNINGAGLGLVAQPCPTLCNPMTVARQAPLSMGFSRKEYWTGLSCPSPGGLPDPGIKPRSPALQADFLPSEPQGKPNVNGGSL